MKPSKITPRVECRLFGRTLGTAARIHFQDTTMILLKDFIPVLSIIKIPHGDVVINVMEGTIAKLTENGSFTEGEELMLWIGILGRSAKVFDGPQKEAH